MSFHSQLGFITGMSGSNTVLVLDLDETLVHTFTAAPQNSQLFAAAHYQLGDNAIGFKRPGLKQFLDFAQNAFTHVGVWTAAEPNYANFIVNAVLVPLGFNPKFLLTGQNCEWIHDSARQVFVRIKPLKKLWTLPELSWLGATPSNTLIIDDRAETALANPTNLIQIAEFTERALFTDNQLARVKQQLQAWLHRRRPTAAAHRPRTQTAAWKRPPTLLKPSFYL